MVPSKTERRRYMPRKQVVSSRDWTQRPFFGRVDVRSTTSSGEANLVLAMSEFKKRDMTAFYGRLKHRIHWPNMAPSNFTLRF